MGAVNPFADFYAVFNTGDPTEKWKRLPSFPRMIDVELTSSCNFRCLMCPTGNLSLDRPAKFMDAKTFEAILWQCRQHGTALRFIGWGEPTLHPDAVRWIAEANLAGLLTHLNTNGSRMTDRFAHRLVDAGLSSIKFSFQGVDRQSYRDMRNVDFFDGLVDSIAAMARARSGYTPFLAASTTITDEAAERVEAFRKRVEPLVDELNIGRTIFDYMDFDKVRVKPQDRERLKSLKARETAEKRHPVPCPEVYDKLSVHVDGSVVVCCNDYSGVVELGNVNDTPIAELWRHPKIEAYRERLARKDYDAPLCKGCFDYMGCTEGGQREATQD